MGQQQTPVPAPARRPRPKVVHTHAHTHHHYAPSVAPLAQPGKVDTYVSMGTQVDEADLAPKPIPPWWRQKLAKAWVKVKPVALCAMEAALFILSRISLGLGFGINWMPLLGVNANSKVR